jgi:hypothetical protein
VEMLRCPTCLSLLLDEAKKCATCGKRLRKRSRPIILGEGGRIDVGPVLPIEIERHARDTVEDAAEDAADPAPTPIAVDAEATDAAYLFSTATRAPRVATSFAVSRAAG